MIHAEPPLDDFADASWYADLVAYCELAPTSHYRDLAVGAVDRPWTDRTSAAGPMLHLRASEVRQDGKIVWTCGESRTAPLIEAAQIRLAIDAQADAACGVEALSRLIGSSVERVQVVVSSPSLRVAPPPSGKLASVLQEQAALSADAKGKLLSVAGQARSECPAVAQVFVHQLENGVASACHGLADQLRAAEVSSCEAGMAYYWALTEAAPAGQFPVPVGGTRFPRSSRAWSAGELVDWLLEHRDEGVRFGR